MQLPCLVFIAQVDFLLEREHTHGHTKSQMSLITLPTNDYIATGVGNDCMLASDYIRSTKYVCRVLCEQQTGESDVRSWPDQAQSHVNHVEILVESRRRRRHAAVRLSLADPAVHR